LQTVSWLGRFSLVDVLTVLVLTVGLDFGLAGGGVNVRCESRRAIVAFGCVAVWALIQGEWMLRIQQAGAARVVNYKGVETRSEGRYKQCWDCIGSPVGVSALACICFALTVTAMTSAIYVFEVDDVSSHVTGAQHSYSLGTIVSDVRYVEFTTIVCVFFVIIIPLLTPVLAIFWAMTGCRPSTGAYVCQLGRMSCMDVFFISSVIFGAEYGVLIPGVLGGVDPCYVVDATATPGYGLALCIIHGFIMTFMISAVSHNMSWTLSPRLPYKPDVQLVPPEDPAATIAPPTAATATGATSDTAAPGADTASVTISTGPGTP